MLTNKYLKENDLFAIHFDKGIEVCVMSKETYNTKLKSVSDLPQFEKVVKTRKNAKHPVLKEENTVNEIFNHLNFTD